MSRKQVLTAAEAKSMKTFSVSLHSTNDKIKYYLLNSSTFTDTYKPLKDMGLEKFVRAVVFDWEVESPEQKVREIYNDQVRRCNSISVDNIKKVLNALEIKIEGVNA